MIARTFGGYNCKHCLTFGDQESVVLIPGMKSGSEKGCPRLQNIAANATFAETGAHHASERSEKSDPILPKQFDLAERSVDEETERDQQHEPAPP